MGTRSTIKFYEEGSKTPILSVYQQYDGYIDGVGHDLAKWLKNKKIVNGYANGMGCLAAQFVADHKTEIGGFYITNSKDEQEYNYKVTHKKGDFVIEVNGDQFKGSPDELLEINSL